MSTAGLTLGARVAVAAHHAAELEQLVTDARETLDELAEALEARPVNDVVRQLGDAATLAEELRADLGELAEKTSSAVLRRVVVRLDKLAKLAAGQRDALAGLDAASAQGAA